MESKKKFFNYTSALKISVVYLIFSSLYILLSDKIIIEFLGDSATVNILNNIQSYKGLVFVFVTSALIFVFVQREINSKEKYIKTIELQNKKLEESEYKYSNLFYSMEQGVTYQNDKGEIIDANPAAIRILGLTLDQMQGKSSMDPDWKAIHEDGSEYPGDGHPSMVALKTGKIVDNVIMGVFNPKQKDYKWIKIDAIPQFRNGKSNPFQVFTTFDDITAERSIKQSLNELYSKYQNIIHTANIAIAELDTGGSYTFVNPAWEEMFGYSSTEALGKNIELIVQPDETDHSMFNKLKNGQITDYQQEQKYRAKNGKIIWCDLYVAANNDLEGNLKSIVAVMIDITEQKQKEDDLKASEQRFRGIVEGAPDPIFIQTNKCFAYLNQHAIELFGAKDEKELLGKPVLDCFHPDFHKSAMERIKKLNIDKKMVHEPFEQILIQLNGNEIWVETKGQPIIYHGENGGLVFVRNVTSKKMAEKELRESKALLENINNNLPGAIIQYKMFPDGKDALIYVSQGSREIWGISPEEAIENNERIWEQIDPNYIEEVKKAIEVSYNNLSPWNIEFKNNLPDGTFKWIEGIGIPQKHEDGSVIWDSIMLDISSRKEVEIRMANYKESLKNMTTEITLVEEKQRKDIAANIHDHLSQSLVISKMKLTDLEKEFKDSGNEKELRQVIEHISNALENSRKITYDLSPPVLYELGIVETLYWLVEKIEEEHKLKAIFTTNIDYLNLSESKLILLFRVIQELINNTIKHACANKIEITLNKENEGMQLTMTDDGEGFDVKSLNQTRLGNTGFGLFAVKERVENLGGNFSISSKIGIGTEIIISVPL